MLINLGQTQQRCKVAAVARLKRWPRAVPRHVARLVAVANQEMTITQALSGDDNRRQRSLASVKRQRERARMREEQPQVKQIRDVVIPITLRLENWPIEWLNAPQML